MSIKQRHILKAWAIVIALLVAGLGKKILFPMTLEAAAPVHQRIPAMASKARSLVQVSVETKSAGQDRVYNLNGRVRVRQNMPHVAVEWRLPAEARLVAGTLTDSQLDAKNGDIMDFEIQVEVEKAGDLDKVYFTASSEINGVRMGNSAVASSQTQLLKASRALTPGERKRNNMIRE